ncbi:CPBP family intramembrane glutamic endopeptidase [Luteitalea sp.]|jgi:membrane protease YdiL (CAAX protease family)|uniref:CPBP family intramembrane glutamic endopeptidase n=1 Tax=Luteitalea sp. TaxID=2004800 RepID=UPI0037CB44B7
MTTTPDALARRAPVWGVLALAFVLLAWGEIRATDPYTSPEFVVGYFWTEIQIVGMLILATALFWPWRRLGLRTPHAPVPWTHVLPLAVVVSLAVGSRLWTAGQLGANPAPDPGTSLLLARTTMLVGINEEWLFRGLALAAFSRWWGWRRGWMMALVAFGCVHLLNLITGVPPAAAAFQFANTMLVGSVFLLAAVATRSLLWPMLGHAVYDWAVIDTSRYITAGAPPWGSLLLPILAIMLGLWSLWTLVRLPERVPYPD